MNDVAGADIRRLVMEIRKELPEAKVTRWRDFGFAVDVELNGRTCVAYQPRIPAGWRSPDDPGQPFILRTVAEIVAAYASAADAK